MVNMGKNCYFSQILPSQAQYLEHLASQEKKMVKDMGVSLIKYVRRRQVSELWGPIP